MHLFFFPFVFVCDGRVHASLHTLRLSRLFPQVPAISYQHRMETRIDFVQSLESDMSVNILTCLKDPADVVHASSVSSLWRHFVITNGLAKQLCLRKFPQLSKIARVTEPDWITTEANGVGSNNSSWDVLKRDHNVYASLLHAMTTLNTSLNGCIGYAVSASSTDRFPSESIVNTLTTKDRYLNRPSYWSSKGHADPDASETLIYKLKADLCVISEINIQPFEAFFQPGKPIYYAKSVRLRLGHPKNPEDENDVLHVPLQQPADDNFIWTYTSEVFPMAQENCLQQFKLQEPVLCIGGYLQIELLGRVQRQHTDNLFYICFSDETNMTPVSSEEEVVEHVGLMGFLLGGYHAGIEAMPWEVMDDEEMDEPVVL
ncbi:hypothetical protein RND71_035085 [Anisodus tanguticus]|uniref:F-box protein n=1 Tax=Anisodus tanguticus TaxID=243964 RepID=A0AAE1R3J1_9SOLA|nr:hypothetical protein RND71_035085 [Anisodus tanguticus]